MRTVRSVPVGGTVFTTASDPGATTIVIVSRSDVPSVVAPLGPVELHQPQVVAPTGLQAAAPVPAAGTITIDEGVLTGLDGTESLTYRCAAVPFHADEAVSEPGGMHPIVFAGELSITGGTGALAGAAGTLHFSGRYSFTENTGYFTLAGTLEVTAQVEPGVEAGAGVGMMTG